MKRITAACLFVCLLLAGRVVHAQGVGTSGEINGTVTDPSGGVVPKASIEANEVAKGVRFTTATDSAGQYRLTGLPPGIYNVSAKSAGFATEVQKGLEVHVGGTAILDFHLKVAATAVQVEVTAESPVVETERGSQADMVNQQYIEDLPIDRRDYLTFTLLMPGASDSTRLTDDQDFRVKQTPQSGLSFYGSNGRGNSVTVDGGEVSNDTGGVRLTLSQDAVQEFQVNRSNYAADLGAANGASINIVSKSGTDNFHGGLFGFFRNDAMDARNPFAYSQALQANQLFNPALPDVAGHPVKDTLQRYQYGGALGGPIKKGKTQFFAAFEGLLQNAQNAVPLLLNTVSLRPDSQQQAALAAIASKPAAIPCLAGPVGTAIATELAIPTTLPGPICAEVLAGALTLNPLLPSGASNPSNAFLLNQFETQGGLFPYNSRTYLASGRVDHQIDSANQLTLTYRYGHDLEENPDVQSLTAYSAGSSTHTYDSTLQGAWFHQFSSRTQNELRVQWDYESFNVIPNEPGEPGLQIPGFINNLGTSIFLSNYSILRRYEFADNMTLLRGKHTIKFGGVELLRGNHTESHTYMPGRFVFSPLPASAFITDPTLPFPTLLTSLQSASFGLPQFYQQGFGDADYPAYTRPLTGLYLQDSWKMTSNFTLNYGVRYEIDNQFNPLTTYYGDVGPRISFAWDPFKDHKTVVRAGYGIFYGPIDAVIPQVDLSLGVLNKNRTSVENQTGGPSVPNQVNNVSAACGYDIPPFPPGTPISAPTGNSPCTRFISIYAVPLAFPPPGIPGVESSAVIYQTLFAEGVIQCTTPTPGNNACITPAGPTGVAQFGVGVANSGPLSAGEQVIFTAQPGYKPPYSQQASIGIEREITPGFSIGVSGIYTHTLRLPVAIDTNLLPTTPTSTIPLANGKMYTYKNWNLFPGSDPLFGLEGQPCAPTLLSPANPYKCFVNPLIVQNNQYTDAASSLYEGLILEVKKRFSDHFTLFGNYTYSKGFDTSTDYNTDFGPQDPTNLGLDRALSEFDERNKVVIAGVFDSPWKNPFLSGFELAPIFNYHSGLPFNLLAGGEVNGDNHTTNERPLGAGRDSGLGPNYIDFDMRLSWQHKVGEKASVRFTAEGFNIANRTNYASVNNEVSPLFGLPAALGGDGNTTFNVHGIKPNYTTVYPSTPLAFTSAFPKRQIQLGLRLIF